MSFLKGMTAKNQTFLAVNASPCPRGYLQEAALQTCYRLETERPLSFQDAVEDCRVDGGNLASIHSRHENAALACKIQTVPNTLWGTGGGVAGALKLQNFNPPRTIN